MSRPGEGKNEAYDLPVEENYYELMEIALSRPKCVLAGYLLLVLFPGRGRRRVSA